MPYRQQNEGNPETLENRGLKWHIEANRNHDKSAFYLPRQYMQVTNGRVYAEGYGGKERDRFRV